MSGPSSPQEDALALMRQAVSAVRKEIDARLRAHGLTHAQWQTLALLDASGAVTPKEVASVLRTDTAAVTRLLDRLEAKRLCQRRRLEVDRRMVALVLTDLGRRALDLTNGLASAAIADQFAAVGMQELAMFGHVLRRIVQAPAA
jgi:DNA-binding MarR family transcriptional regulator